MLDTAEFGKRGYLLEDFRLFHLRDSRAEALDLHYHEFDKLVFHLAGRVTYHVEGKRYFLKPCDILLVGRSLIHRPVIDAHVPYERMVLWMKGEYLEQLGGADCDLRTCFRVTEERGIHLCRPQGEDRARYRRLFEELERAGADGGFGGRLLSRSRLAELLVALNRDLLSGAAGGEEDYRFDAKMEEVTRYIGEHLSEELSIQRLAGACYLSRYHLMHRFKEVYGITVHQYVRQKRLQRAAEEIRRGVPVLKAAAEAGFGDYSAFLRSFRQSYGKSPREWR